MLSYGRLQQQSIVTFFQIIPYHPFTHLRGEEVIVRFIYAVQTLSASPRLGVERKLPGAQSLDVASL